MDKQRLQALHAQAHECDRLVLRIDGHPERRRQQIGLGLEVDLLAVFGGSR
jgi:hypothetical protein